MYQEPRWLNCQYGVIKVKAPTAGSYQQIAIDTYGPGDDNAECSSDEDREYLASNHATNLTNGWYITQVYFQGKFTLWGTATYTSEFYIQFYYDPS